MFDSTLISKESGSNKPFSKFDDINKEILTLLQGEDTLQHNHLVIILIE